jgi:hypothetical protein
MSGNRQKSQTPYGDALLERLPLASSTSASREDVLASMSDSQRNILADLIERISKFVQMLFEQLGFVSDSYEDIAKKVAPGLDPELRGLAVGILEEQQPYEVRKLDTASDKRSASAEAKAAVLDDVLQKFTEAEARSAALQQEPVVDDLTQTIPPAPAAAPTTPSRNTLLDFIGAGEGDYDSANRGTISGNIVGSEMQALRRGKSISEMTIGEIAELQKISDPNNEERLFAVGKYQTIPDTLAMAVSGLGLSEETVFSPAVQDQIGMYLVTEKRPKVGRYLRGEEGITEDDALLSLAQEFASIPVPRAVKQGEFGSWPKMDLMPGDSFYANPAATKGNAARHTIEETRGALQSAYPRS